MHNVAKSTQTISYCLTAPSFLWLWVAALLLVAATSGLGQMVTYPRLEASFTISGLASDPFDYAATDVEVSIATPGGSTIILPAFFDGGTTWRVRHTPMVPGLYQITGLTLNGQPLSVSNLQPASWTVSGAPVGPGYVRVDPANTNRFITSNGRRYFPLGHNVAWWTNNTFLANIISKFGGSRENWTRIWMTHFYDSLNLEWPKVGNFGQFSLSVAQKWDAIVSAAEQSSVCIQVTLQHHGQYSSIPGSNVNPNWEQNPYNSANGGFLANASQFFTNVTAKTYTKRKYRYILARWGYSPAVAAWELFNEVQFTDAAYAGQWANIAAWHDEMAQFIRSQDAYQHLITTSSDLSQPIWGQCDYYQHHDYPSGDLIAALRSPPGVPGGQPVKPIFGGECDRNSTPFYGFHAPLWAGLMGAQSGAAEQWYGDQLEAENAYSLFRAGRDFVLMSGLADQDILNQSAPHVTCSQNSSLVFSPGGGWATATQSTFTVGDIAPDGIGSLPSYLQGYYHSSMTPNGYTFLVNFPQSGTFSVQVLQIAAAGAGLRIISDGVTVTNQNFPGTGSNVSTNLTIPINVTAGAHTITLTNFALDWLLLGNITLNPYTPMLGAYQVGNTNFAALWLWHRTNIYNASASATLGGTVPLSGLQPGIYSATWWDSFADVALSNFTFTVVDSTPVTLATPAILRSVALFAGKPAQATVSAPLLTQTMGTNSPELDLPLIITNSGGLPLAYSLSVTGASPVLYSFSDSTRSGGPTFAWKDISAVGSNLTTHFMALAPPKTAKDEGIAGPVNIGFAFPFYSGGQSPDRFTQLYISPNGFVAFNPFSGDSSTNKPLPNAMAPTNLVAFLWDDLDLSTSGSVYALSDPITGVFTLQFQNVLFKGSSATVNCQLILKTSGEILMQYKSLGISNACTVGIQNAAADQGLLIAYNQNYLQSNLCVRLNPAPWVGLSACAGLVPKSNNDTINLSFSPAAVTPGTYTATLLVNTADPAQPLTVLPVTLNLLTGPSGLAVSALTWAQVGLMWQDNSPNETGFSLERKTDTNGVYAPIITLGAGITNFTDTNVTSRTTYGYRVSAFNAAGPSSYSAELLLATPPAPIELWRQANFGTMDNTGDAADNADPDHDGLVNLVEYALGLDPNVPSQNPLAYAYNDGHLVITYTRPHPTPADVQYVVEVTSDLASGVWNSGPAYTSQAVMDNGDGTETVTVTDLAGPPSMPVHFLRLRLSH